jgi:protein-disulfide isomerase
MRGGLSAPVTLLEYGDFECPQCAAAYPILTELQRRGGDRLRFAFRHFPLTNAHPNAQLAAEAAEWADSQGAFWAMHDALYEQQAQLSRARVVEIAGDLGLDRRSLENAWHQHTFFPRVKEDFLGGVRGMVTGTPAFFINGARHEGAWDAESLGQAIDAAISDRAEAPPGPDLPAPAAGPPR